MIINYAQSSQEYNRCIHYKFIFMIILNQSYSIHFFHVFV
jgi:hypothetical protein